MKTKVWLKNMAAACILCALLLLSGGTVLAATVVQTDKTTAGSGNVLLGMEGSFLVDTESALNRINEIRLEACQEGVKNPATGAKLTEADYVPIRWSSDLEYIARIRAAEASLTMQHVRTNGQICFYLYSPRGIQSWAEVLAWNWTESVIYGINQWYGEKDDWVNNTGNVTGHYESLIDPTNLYVGLGTFYSENSYYPNTTAGEFSSNYYSGLDETQAQGIDDAIQMLEIRQQNITRYYISGEKTGQAGDRVELKLAASVNYGYTADGLIVMDGVTWTSSDPSVAVVDSSGTLTVLHCGTTTITAQYGSTTCTLSFTANHIAVTDEAVAATCISTGKTEGSHCSVCNTVLKEQQEIPVTDDHSYGSWKVSVKPTYTSTGTKVRTCSICGKQQTKTVKKLTLAKASGVTVKALSGQKIRITWKKVSGATGYQIYCKAGKNGTYKRIKVTSKLTYTQTKCKAGTVYYYRVRAYRKVATKKYVYSSFSALKYARAK